MLKKAKRVCERLFDENQRFVLFAYHGFYKRMNDETYLKKMFRARMGKELDLEHPKTFNEKLQWLKLNDRKQLYTKMVDKYEAKRYVADKIGDQYIIRNYGVWEHFDDIDFSALPRKFVLKCTHDSGGIVICTDKCQFDKSAARKKLEGCLKNNYYWIGREWPYKNVRPRIIAEEFMADDTNNELNDYKFMCFGGKVKASFVCSNRFSKAGLNVTFYDNDWKRLPFTRHYPASTTEIDKPKKYEEMVELAERLSQGIPFLRVDFYEIKGKIYFGELTFFPGSGFEEFDPNQWDEILGEWIEIPV